MYTTAPASPIDLPTPPEVVSGVPFLRLESEEPAGQTSGDTRHRLGCSGHAALFLLALAGSCSAVYWSASREAALSGRPMTSDSMGLGWPLFVPFVYLALLPIYTLARLVTATVVRRVRRHRPSGR